MPRHEYTASEALRHLVDKIAARDEQLATQVLAAVNAGRDVQEVERQGRRKSRFYRHTVPYSPEEALEIALEVLSAHFIEQPRFINAFHDDMVQAGLRAGDAHSWKVEEVEGIGAEKTVEIEVQTATEIIPTETALRLQSQETIVMQRVPADEIEEEEANLARLRQLVDFTERGRDGDAERSRSRY